MTPQKIVIIGAGGFGREVAWLIEDINASGGQWDLAGFVDDNEELVGKSIGRYPILGGMDWLKGQNSLHAVCAVGVARIRKQIVDGLEGASVKWATLVHPSVIMPRSTQLQPPAMGEGCIVCASNVITVNVSIGRHVIVNLGCTIGHDALLADFVTLLPSVNVSGHVVLEEGADVGTGCQIIQRLRVGSGTTIGAGAVVVRDLPANCTAVGVPAKPIKRSQ
jgi:sugar O-acyltransferase (sialic acid O-acetyltransferase NeuD family)